MTWFLVESGISLARQKRVFDGAGVAYAHVEIRVPHSVKGLAFPEEKWEDVKELFRLTGAYVSEQTDNPVVLLMQSTASVVIVDSGRNLEHYEDELEPVLREYALRLGVEVHVSNPHGTVSEPLTEDGKLYIRIWSVPQTTDTYTMYRACGITLSANQGDAVLSSGIGIPLIDSEGVVVAEVVGGTLYILFDLPHGANAGKLLKAILELYVFMQKPSEEREKFLQDMAARELKRSREAYVKECSTRIDYARETLKSGIEGDRQHIEYAQQSITEYVRSLDDKQRSLAQLEATGLEQGTRFEEEFDKLVALHWVQRVTVKRGVVSVFTGQIDVPYEGVVYDIGKFRIDIKVDGRNGGVRCHNLTRQVHDYNHPHVLSDGSCCLGNISSGVGSLIGQYEYAVLANILYQYLGTYNASNPYHDIGNWPVKKSE